MEEARNREPASRLSFRVKLEMWTLESCSICPMKVKVTEKSIGERLVNRMSGRADGNS